MRLQRLPHLGQLIGAATLLSLQFNVAHAKEELTLYDTLRTALQNAPTILLSQQGVAQAKSIAQIQGGAFDFTLYGTGVINQDQTPNLANQRSPSSGGHTETDSQSLIAGISKQFRTGINTDFSVSINRADVIHPINPATSHLPASNRSTVNFRITLPLLKGRGRVSAAAAETAALLGAESTELNLHHAVSDTVNRAVTLYWAYKSANDGLALDKASEQRVRALAEDVYEQALETLGSREAVKAQYQSELSNVTGYLNAKQSEIAQSEQLVARAKSNLALAIGIAFDKFEHLGLPIDEFPANLETVDVNDPDLIKTWRKLAINNRLDLKALQKSEEAAAVQLAKARRDLLPQLNVTLNYGYKGQVVGDEFQDFYQSVNHNHPGPTASATLNYRQPLGNNVARGALGQNRAAHQQTIIRLNDLKRNIRVQLDTNLVTLKQRYAELELRKKAVDSFLLSYQELRAKSGSSRPGTNTLFAIMDIEDKLTVASKQYLAAQSNLAALLSTIRFQTGVLLDMQDDYGTVRLTNLSKLPE